MQLNFCGGCISKPKPKQEKAGKRHAQPQPVHNHQSKGAQTVPVEDEKEFDEFIRGVQRQTSQLQAQQARELAALQKEMAQYQQQSDRIGEALARPIQSASIDDEELERELAALENE
jgi:hypothetical protein